MLPAGELAPKAETRAPVQAKQPQQAEQAQQPGTPQQSRRGPQSKPRQQPPQPEQPKPQPPREQRQRPRKDESRSVERVVLVTGFDPFGGERLNPSWEICQRLPREIAGLRVETCRVPCEFRRAIEVVAEAIERHRPALVISLGQAGGRTHMSVERVAINVDDARIDDNAGGKPIDEPIAANGPAGYFATLPIKAMTLAMREAGAPAEVSNTAGTFVCNHLMYGVLHFLAGSGNPARAGFIHVPYAGEQVTGKPGIASLSLDTMVAGVQAAIAAAAAREQDVAAAEGRLD